MPNTAPIDVETFRLSHHRFLCIDDDVYHIGASIKDLGKKLVWFLQDGQYLHQMNWWKDQAGNKKKSEFLLSMEELFRDQFPG